jgi:small multidrug resistance pump
LDSKERIVTWLLLGFAIILEVIGTTCLKLSHGYSRLVPTILVFVFYGLSMGLMSIVMKRIDVSVTYAIWSGMGTALIAAIGVAFFGEALSAVRAAAIALIIVGVVMLNVGGAIH